jgi:hypothetical protein
MLETSAGVARGMPAVAAAAVAVMDECGAFVRGIGAGAYAGPSRVLRGGTIGKHVRHTLDHFRAALGGLEPAGIVDYDRRQRGVPMERDSRVALNAIAALRRRVALVAEGDLARPVLVRMMLSRDGSGAEMGSTLGRELAFATSHAVHHCAMLGAIAAEFGVAVAPGFGMAPGTQHAAGVQR